jgi:hypothetical protein
VGWVFMVTVGDMVGGSKGVGEGDLLFVLGQKVRGVGWGASGVMIGVRWIVGVVGVAVLYQVGWVRCQVGCIILGQMWSWSCKICRVQQILSRGRSLD